MEGICRICDSVLSQGDMVFIKVLNRQMIFRVHCSKCDMEYPANEKGDILNLGRTPTFE